MLRFVSVYRPLALTLALGFAIPLLADPLPTPPVCIATPATEAANAANPSACRWLGPYRNRGLRRIP
jgi:hypothetical protein